MTNASAKKVAPAGFVPTKKVTFEKGDFQTVNITPFSSDGWHPVGIEMLCFGDIDDGGELLAFLIEAAGENQESIDYEALLKCKVKDGIVETVYTPGIMAADNELFLVSGENRFLLSYDLDNSLFTVGNLKGKLTERLYKKADDTDGRSVALLLSPINPDLRVQYQIPFILKKMEVVSELIGDGVEVSQELFDFLLLNDGVEGIANLLLQTLGGGSRQKLYELGVGKWRVKGWNLLKSESNFPDNYELFLEGMNGEKVEGSYYTNKALTQTLAAMGDSIKRMGRQLQLIITDVRPYNQTYAVTASLQLIPETDLIKLKSAAVAAPQLPQARRPENAAEFLRTLNPIDVQVVPAEAAQTDQPALPAQPAATVQAIDGTEVDADYDPIPF